MNKGNFFRRTVSTLFIVSIMLFASVTHAEIYTGEGSYIMSEGENLGVAKERAKADAMRNAAEKAGTYVRSYTKTRNLTLEEDIIETMTASIIKLIGNPNFLPYEQLDNLEGLLIRVIVNVQIEDSDINRWLNNDEKHKSELIALRRANEEQARQIEELKRKLANNPQDKEQIVKEFEVEDKIFLSNQKVREAWKFYENGDYNGVIKLNDEALQLNPNNSLAYYGRGNAYAYLGQYERAIQDYDKAIQINSNYANAYNNRGTSYKNLGQYERAIQDFNKALEFKEHEFIYNNRGVAYAVLGQKEQAIQDYSKAIQLNPSYSTAYYNRGIVYNDLGQKELAIQDYSKAIQLNPNYSEAYYNRGVIYYYLRQYENALKDFEKDLELNINDKYTKIGIELCRKALGW